MVTALLNLVCICWCSTSFSERLSLLPICVGVIRKNLHGDFHPMRVAQLKRYWVFPSMLPVVLHFHITPFTYFHKRSPYIPFDCRFANKPIPPTLCCFYYFTVSTHLSSHLNGEEKLHAWEADISWGIFRFSRLPHIPVYSVGRTVFHAVFWRIIAFWDRKEYIVQTLHMKSSLSQ